MRVGGQKMGNGLSGCYNLNGWNHLFSPNSPAALQGEIACDLYWGRSTGSGNVKNGNTERNALVQYAPGTTEKAPMKNVPLKTILILAAIVVLYFTLFKK